MVNGNSNSVGECVVTPISIEPAHLVTILSSLTSNNSFGFNGLDVNTTPLLKSSMALRKKFTPLVYKARAVAEKLSDAENVSLFT